MPTIKEYTATDRRLTQPAEGYAAFETAARRINPAYNETARFTAEQGKIASDSYNERMWPWDFLDARGGGGGGRGRGGGGRDSAGGGVGFKVEGGVNNLYNSPFGSNGQTSRAAGALGAMAQQFNGTQISKDAQFKDGANEDISKARQGKEGRGFYEPDPSGFAREKMPPGTPNPYAPFGAAPDKYRQPPPIPTTPSRPVDENGSPTAPYPKRNEDPYASNDDYGYGRMEMYKNPSYEPGAKHSPEYVPVWTPYEYGGGSDPGPIQQFKNWVGETVKPSTEGREDFPYE